jgi:hypothetical protein
MMRMRGVGLAAVGTAAIATSPEVRAVIGGAASVRFTVVPAEAGSLGGTSYNPDAEAYGDRILSFLPSSNG